MKRIVIFFIIILCCPFCMAQQSYSKQDSLYSIKIYIAHQYVDAWVNVHKNDRNYDNYQLLKTYNGGHDSIYLYKANSLDGSILSVIGWSGGEKIYNKIFDTPITDWSNIDTNLNLINKNINIKEPYLSEIKNKEDLIINTINKFRNPPYLANIVAEEVSKEVDYSFSSELFRQHWLVFFIDVVIGIIICLIICLIVQKRKDVKKEINVDRYDEEELKRMMQKVTSKISLLEDNVKDCCRIKNIESLLQDIKKSFNTICSNSPTDQSKIGITQGVSEIKDSNSSSKFVYAISDGNGILKECKDTDDYQYKVYYGTKINEGYFEFVGNSLYAINNSSAVLDGYCDIVDRHENAKCIITNSKGVVIPVGEHKWKVNKNARIKLVI